MNKMNAFARNNNDRRILYHILPYLKISESLVAFKFDFNSLVVFLYQRDLGGFDLNTAGVNITRVISD